MLVLTRKKKQSLMLGEDIVVQVLEVHGDQVRIGISAPASLKIYRKEIYDEIHAENQAAAAIAGNALNSLPTLTQSTAERSETKAPQ